MPSYIEQLRKDTGDAYSDLSDSEIAQALHNKYQAESGTKVDFNTFASEVGLDTSAPDFGSPQDQAQADTSQPITGQDFPQEQQQAQISPNVAEHPQTPQIDESQLVSRGTMIPASSGRFAPAGDTQGGFGEISKEDINNKLGMSAGEMLYDITPEDPWSEILQKNIQDIPAKIQRGVAGALDVGSPLFKELGMFDYAGKQEEPLTRTLSQKLWTDAQSKVEENQPFIKHGTAKYYGASILNAVEDMGLSVASSMLTKNPTLGLGVMTGQVFLNKKAQSLSEGKSEARANLDATVYAMAEGWTEKIPLGILTKPGQKWLSRTLKEIGAEGLQEPLSQGLELAYDRGIFKEGEPLTLREVVRQLWDAGIIGMGAGGVLAVTTGGLPESKQKQAGRAFRSLIEQTDLLNASDLEIVSQFAPPQNNAQAVYQEAVKEKASITGVSYSAPQQYGAAFSMDRRGETRGEDRRQNLEQRVKVQDMTPEEMKKALLTSDVTGIKNRRAYEETPRKPVQVSIDADSLKWINKEMSPATGDKLLKTVAQAINEETDAGFHFSGDEFMVEANTPEEANQIMERVNERLKQAEITAKKPDGTIIVKKGLEITHGIGETKDAADYALSQEKTAREQRGERAARGEAPPGVVITAPEGQQDIGREAPAEEVTKKQTEKTAPKETKKTSSTAAPRLRRAADTLEKTIQKKLNPGVNQQAPTARRARIAAGMGSEGRELQRIQGVMRNLADAQETGTTSETLSNITSRAEVETLLSREEIPAVRIDHRGINELLEAAKGLKGISEARSTVTRISGIDNVITRPSQIAAIDTLVKAANKAGKKPLQYSYALDQIKAFNRAKRLGIDTQERWASARKELLALERPVTQVSAKERTVKELERELIGNKIPGFFATPQPVIDEVMAELDLDEGMSVLEPEAGNGDMADAAREAGGKVDVIEISGQLQEVLKAKEHNLVDTDFMSYTGKKYDRILMNPPFEKQADIDHVLHAYELLKPGGRLVAVMSESTFFRDNKKSVDFRSQVDEFGHIVDLPEGAFKKGKFRTTGVKSRIVVMDKPGKESGVQSSRGKRDKGIQSVWAPGATYVPMLRGKPITDITIEAAQVPDKPIRREHIIKRMERLFGVKIYKGRVKGKTRLGFFRASNSEIRTKEHNDLEVTAHEVTHWIDDRYPAFARAYRREPYKTELKGVSYDVKNIKEGFAEFGRLYMTQESEAVLYAPQFYDKFVEIMEAEGIKDKIDEIKDEMHKWYNQGGVERFRSKTGTEPEPLRQRIAAAADGLIDSKIAQIFDALHGLKVMERNLTGTIGDADVSPYKSMRNLAGARAVVKAVFEHGTIDYDEKGDIVFTGKGLREIFEPVAHVFDDTMLYFAARRASELMKQGREHHYEPDEIKAVLELADAHPEMKTTFDEYQAFNSRMMDFYEHSGLINKESRAAMEEMNKDYVPFFRVQEEITGEMVTKRSGAPFKRLKGGTANVADIFDNITFGTATLIHEALANRAKVRAYNMVSKFKDGALYAVHINKEIKPTEVEIRQLEDAFIKGLGMDTKAYRKAQSMHMSDPKIDGILDIMSGNLGDFMTFFTFGHAPMGTDVDSVMIDGKREFYQIADPMFMKAMESLNAKPLGMAMRVMAGFKNTLTRTITTMPDFQLPNILRDSFSGFALSHGGMIPIIDSVKGAYNRIMTDDIYWEFMANGGGYASTVHGETQATRRHLEKLYNAHGVDYRTVLDTPAKLLEMLEEFNSAFEYGTRLAEYKAMRKKGASKQEASFQGREIGTDFAMRGYSEFIRFFSTTVPFFNARLQGLYRLEREAFESGGKQVKWGEHAGRLALRGLTAITLPSLALYLINKDDERYKKLDEWIKDLHWVIFIPGIDHPFLIPKPFEVGAIFATIPERMTQLYIENNGEQFADAMKRVFLDTFSLNPTPQIIKPLVETEVSNKKFTGAPIIPEDLKDVESWEQFRPYTSDSMVKLGKALHVSPLKLEHWMRGYFGTLGLYTMMGADGLIGDKFGGEVPEKRIDEIPIYRRFVRQQPYRGTSYETQFYNLATETRRITKTFNKIRNEGRTKDLNEYIGNDDRELLFGLQISVTDVMQSASMINQGIRMIRQDPKLSGREKRKQIDNLQQQKNDLMETAAKSLNKRDLMRIQKKLDEIK